MKNILRHLWQLPQHLVAWVIIALGSYTYESDYKGCRVYVKKSNDDVYRGVSLGGYIFLDASLMTEPYIAHEYGHSRQSMMLGWLYLIVIGVASAASPLEGAMRYERFPEDWANKLGGVRVVRTGPLACNYKLEMI